MTRMTREERRLQDLAHRHEQVEINKTFPIRVLMALAEADKLGLNTRVTFTQDKSAVVVTVNAEEHHLGYKETSAVEVKLAPSIDNYTKQWCMDDTEILIARVQPYKDEKARLAAVKVQALAKLTDEEKLALGLVEPRKDRW